MASTSNTATRRVLSPLNVNSPVSRNISTLKGAEGIEIRRQGKAIECTNSITGKDKNPAPNCQQATISSDNCNLDDAEGGDERPRKRVRIESEANPAQQLTGTLDCTPLNSEGSTAGHVEDQEPVRTAVDETSQVCDARSPSTPVSKAPSFGSRSIGVDDSQNIALSEARVVPAALLFSSPTVPRLTKEEAREKADALKLRLRLASYRVFTNQITTPWKDLEVRTMPRTMGKLGMLPSSISSDPIQPPTPWTGTKRQGYSNSEIDIPSSPPAAYTATRLASMALSVPALSRPYENVALPATVSYAVSNTPEGDAASSDFKRSIASDGLLSLMRQQDS